MSRVDSLRGGSEQTIVEADGIVHSGDHDEDFADLAGVAAGERLSDPRGSGSSSSFRTTSFQESQNLQNAADHDQHDLIHWIRHGSFPAGSALVERVSILERDDPDPYPPSGIDPAMPAWLSQCKNLYLDIGSNIGVQVRKLFQSELYTKNPVEKLFQDAFGRGEHMCWSG